MKMKNKKAEQMAARKRHLEQRKKKRTEPTFERLAPTLQEKPTILIVCEGKNTEPSYFNQFRLSSATVTSVGEGYNTTSLITRAKELADKKNYDQVWCVFDKDDHNDHDFNKAVSSENEKFRIVYSNQAFEYWLILHFDDHQGGQMHRNHYNKKINELLQPYNVIYDSKSKKVSEGFFELLDGVDEKTKKKRVDLAMKRAERNLKKFNHTNAAKKESSTTVFKLVRELLKYL